MKILWNLLCQYNNTYTNGRLKKKNVAIVATVPPEQTKTTIAFTHSQNKCHNNIYKTIHIQILWNLLYSKTIYIKGKKKYQKKTKQNKIVTIVATVEKSAHQSIVTATALAQCKHTECTVPKHCSGIAAFYIH